MKLELNKKYITRKGDIVKIVELYDSENYLGNNKIVYKQDGKFSFNKECDIDLIEEYKK